MSDNYEPEPVQCKKIFIGGLASVTTDDSLKDFYDQWGEVVDYIVMKDGTSKRSRGFGFITYADEASVDACMAARPHNIDGKTVDPKRAIPKDMGKGQAESNLSVKKLFVSGLEERHTEDMLSEYFSQFGTVINCEIPQDRDKGGNRGYGFVTFDDYDPVDKCVLYKMHLIEGKLCPVKKGLSKEESRRAQQNERERGARGDRSRGTERSYGGGGGGWNNDSSYYGPPSGGWSMPPQGGWGGGWSGGYGGWQQPMGYAQPAGYGPAGPYAMGGGYGMAMGGGGWSGGGGWQQQQSSAPLQPPGVQGGWSSSGTSQM